MGEAAASALEEKKSQTEELRQQLTKADGRFAQAKYDIDQAERKEITVTEDKDQAKAEQENAAKTLDTANGLANAAALKAGAAQNADEEQMRALLRDPEEA